MGTLFLVPKELRSRLIPPLTITLITYFYVLIVDSEALFALFLNFSVIIFFTSYLRRQKGKLHRGNSRPKKF
ncbi:MAG: hypothetical protein O4803_13120 [Trichodesmium sp. St15_bin1_1]|nr:hypothetical protein [Trichodesmium sp. St15_bin1_1]